MSDAMLTGILVLAGVCLGAVLGIGGTISLLRWRSGSFRRNSDIPDILGKWSCEWFDDAGDGETPKVVDTLEIRHWTVKGGFEGLGHQPQFSLSYPVTGEIDPSRVVTLSYKAARYPYEPNRGVVCMIVSRDASAMEGRWFGRRFSGVLGGGRVKCLREHGS